MRKHSYPVLLCLFFCMVCLLVTGCENGSGHGTATGTDPAQSGDPAATSTEPGQGSLIPADLGNGTVYYVSSTSGDDANDGLSPETAFKTASRAGTVALNAGDSILFKRGDVFEGAHLIINGTGEAADGRWITVDAYGDGEAPLFKTASQNAPAVSFEACAGGCRVRNISVSGYLQGFGSVKSDSAPLDGVIISDCRIDSVTLGRRMRDGDAAYLPNKASLAYGIYLKNVVNLTVTGLTITDTDCPIRVLAGNAVFDDLYISDSHIQGVMLYGGEGDLSMRALMDTTGNITFKNSKILFTGDRGATFGTTGILVENLHDCTVENVEIAYTYNVLGGFDACAVDWEQNNVNCILDGVYAHDNYGPMLLAMEHAESSGHSKGNVIRNCVSVNNGRHGTAEVGSFLNQYLYPETVSQRITVENCTDIGLPGSSSYSYDGVLGKAEESERLAVNGLTSGTLDLYEGFDGPSLTFTTETVLSGSRLVLSAGTPVFSGFKGNGYSFSALIRGDTDVFFLSDGSDSVGYCWSFANGKVIFNKLLGGNASKLGEAETGADTDSWYRLRISLSDSGILTYVNDTLIGTVQDNTFEYGCIGFRSVSGGLMDDFYVYRNRKAVRNADTYTVDCEGAITVLTASGSEHYGEEKNWTVSGIGEWLYRPHGAGWGEITGKDAAISYRSVEIDAKSADTVQVVLMNGTDSGKVHIEFTTDGGKTWYGPTIDTACRGTDPDQASWFAPYQKYVVPIGEDEHWNGIVNGFRIRFEGTTGPVAVKTATFYTAKPVVDPGDEPDSFSGNGMHGWVDGWLHVYREPVPVSELHVKQDPETGRLVFNTKDCTELFVLNNESEDPEKQQGRARFPAGDMAKAFTVEFDIDFTGTYFAICFGGRDDLNVTDGFMTVAFINDWTFIKTENIGGQSVIDTDNLRQNINGAGKKHVVISYADYLLTVTVDGETYWKDYKIEKNQISTGYFGMFFQSEFNNGYISDMKITNGVTGYSQIFFAK